MRNFYKHKILSVTVSFLYLFPVFSQNRLDSIQHLPDVTITAKTFKEVIPSQKLSGKELEKLNSQSVADALRYFSGVQLKDYGGVGGIKTVNIRSMGSQHVGVFYDGIQISNAQNGQVDLGMFSLDNIEEISLYNGQKSEIFQPAKDFASGGAIYLRSRKPRFTEGKTTHLKATLKAGSFDVINPSLLFEYKISPQINTSFSAEWLNASGKYKFRYRRVNPAGEIAYDTTATRQNGDINATRLEAGLFGTIKDGTWQARFYNYNSERGIPGAIVNNVWRRGERIWDTNSFMQGTVQKEFTHRYKSMLNVKYAFYRTHYVNNDDKLIQVDNLYKQKEIYLSSANVYTILPQWDVSVSYDFQWNELRSDMRDFVYPTRYTHLLAAATSYTWGPLKVLGSCLGSFVKDRIREIESPKPKRIVSPSAYLSVKPFSRPELYIRAFYKKSFRMPTFNDLYYADMGNSKLNPENATQYDIGITYSKNWDDGFFRTFSIQTDGYYNSIKNKIIAYPKGQQFRWTILNLGKVDINGIDISAQTTCSPINRLFITLKGQYTYQKAIDVTDPSDNYYRDQIPYIPWHSGSAVLQAAYRGWYANYSFIYVGERYNQQENIRYNYTQPWYTSDISLIKEFHLKFGTLKAAIEVNNLLSQDYDVILNYPMPKRNYKFTLSIEI
ncbi:TonB-dependent receptor plug domain-containing protein [Coprobacter tertius]|uniref:TonB-dependent receptor n=1 Tax=Coprobacter tertius TaxID=2944915 RepID=A0ABT1MIN7_9BACT|nr:TonB-dependent receptor [Coprobacter tertius]MCP9612477.1 TonB-dependent receptor [Coprobacter tertius]